MLEHPPKNDVDRSIRDDEARAALDNLVVSTSFSGSNRLIGFLRYVVEETLEGRGDVIRGKSIALDVYGYDPDEIERRESVVRVDAGRVRRKLHEYYEAEGSDDHIVIELPKGGYVPVFRIATRAAPLGAATANITRKLRVNFLIGALVLGICGLAVLIWQIQTKPSNSAVTTDDERTQRSVLFDTSPRRLEAVNLAEKGRDLIFPAFAPERLRAAMQVFEATINLDETYEGGYAGAAQLYGLYSVLSVDTAITNSALKSAVENANKALELAPTSSWAVSAKAWAAFVGGDHDAALNWSLKAVLLSPQDPHVLEFDALISLYSGEFERVIKTTTQATIPKGDETGYVFQNARGAAHYHTQDYENSIASFEDAVESGAPMGPVIVAYLMAANHYLGHKDRADKLAKQYSDTWPNQRIDLLFSRLFKEARHGEQLAEGMRAAGWEPRE